MAKTKKLSLAIFETPTECRECPCIYVTTRNLTNTTPIREWCPLKPVVFDEVYAK